MTVGKPKVNAPTEPLFTYVAPDGNSHIVGVIKMHLRDGSYQGARVDVADISTGYRFADVNVKELEPFLSTAMTDRSTHPGNEGSKSE